MPLEILELNGYPLQSNRCSSAVQDNFCPFLEGACTKFFPDGTPNGVCTMKLSSAAAEPVICCPKRLYGGALATLKRVADQAFGANIPFAAAEQLLEGVEQQVIPFGHRHGKELRMQFRKSKFSVDWVLALVDQNLSLLEYVAVEVQTIDTTGNYRTQLRDAYLELGVSRVRDEPARKLSGGFNWENVNKRILPQLITKGHILRRESLCRKGLFFICPDPVAQRILQRLGSIEQEYQPQPGAVTFHRYQLDQQGLLNLDGTQALDFLGTATTTTDQLADALTSPRDLPPADAYGELISDALQKRF